MTPQKLTKEYTRDTTLIIQQAWCTALEKHQGELGLKEFAGQVLTLHYLHDGVIEIWENTAWTPALMDRMLERNKESERWYDEHTQGHLDDLKVMQEYWQRGCTESIDELTLLVERVFTNMYLFDWMYYSSLDERTPPAIRERARTVRERDVYFDNTDRFIRKSLVALYPALAGYEQGILRHEIANPPPLEVLKARKKRFVIVGEHESFEGTLDEYQAAHPELMFVIEKPEAQESQLRGQVAYKGKIEGVVRVLTRKEQVGELMEGEILVSTMTTPDFVPAMKKAAAIVTDEGGIMCHAAIVARELKKPCIIGTKFATQVLKDGDRVEVDAEQGIVRKL